MHDPTSRPANRARSLLHVISAASVLGLIQLLSPERLVLVAAAFLVWAWSMEISRRFSPGINRVVMWVFGPVAHAHEVRGVNSATWYTTALFALSLVASPMECALAVTVLGVGDPVAALIGRRWGRVRLAAGRSLEGSLAFVASGGAASLAMLLTLYPVTVGQAVPLAVASAMAGAVGELLTRKLDDNLVIPLAAAAGAAVAAAAF